MQCFCSPLHMCRHGTPRYVPLASQFWHLSNFLIAYHHARLSSMTTKTTKANLTTLITQTTLITLKIRPYPPNNNLQKGQKTFNKFWRNKNQDYQFAIFIEGLSGRTICLKWHLNKIVWKTICGIYLVRQSVKMLFGDYLPNFHQNIHMIRGTVCKILKKFRVKSKLLTKSQLISTAFKAWKWLWHNYYKHFQRQALMNSWILG